MGNVVLDILFASHFSASTPRMPEGRYGERPCASGIKRLGPEGFWVFCFVLFLFLSSSFF